MARVVLTGATGFVGRQIHRSLVDAGHDVSVVLRPGSEARLVAPVDREGLVTSADLFAESGEWWKTVLTGVDAVIHCAWYVVPGKYLDAAENFDCVSGTLRMARGAAAAGVRHFIGVGTCFEYRLPSEALAVDSELSPATLYAACKLSVYHMLTQFFTKQGTNFSWCRLFYLFGEGEHPARLVPYVHERLGKGEVARLSAGTQRRDFLDVVQAGAMIANVVATGQSGAINICSGKSTTIRQLVEAIADEYGRRDLLEFGTAAIHPSDPAAVVGICNAIVPNRSPEANS
jgi:dTDP-6-deoxy-L-talose 4-dehydrogenase (NAD+)